LNAALKHLQEFVHRAAVLPGTPGNSGDGGKHILDAVVEFAH
jgi:hypothetical protein